MSIAETEKLYWQDPHQSAFEIPNGSFTIAEHAGKTAIVLERTLFYPEGGGQLGDTGSLVIGGREIAIVDTQITDAGSILHVLETALPPDVQPSSANITGVIDMDRRRDHMAQHTAQHALSRALADIAKAETVSARLGSSSCTIDADKPGISDGDLHKVEDLVNGLIHSDVEVRAHYPDADALAKMPLRKQPTKGGETVRIIEIAEFDLTPCGGTHCTRTGQIGQARIVGVEKYKGMLRISFVAGLRALVDARTKHAALAQIGADLTCGISEVPAAVTKLRANLKDARTQLDVARSELADFVARAAVERASPDSELLTLERSNDDIATLRLLVNKVTAAAPHLIVLAASHDPATDELIFVLQRGAKTPNALDCGATVQALSKAYGGRGGGRPERAEGRFPKSVPPDAISQAVMATIHP